VKTILEEFDAVGGPAKRRIGSDGFVAGPTDAGEYLVAYCGRHTSRRYPHWSSIPWGTPLKEEKGELMVQLRGTWEKLAKYSPVTRADVVRQHGLLYGTGKVPTTWVFNDFGHVTCYLFRDLNFNGILDSRERIHGEFLHTTPSDEAATSLGLRFSLGESHGCVHLRPLDIDRMIAKGYLRRGRRVVIHRYSERTIPFRRTGASARSSFEVHFFPGIQKLFVVGRSRY
jgi:hypothetical protein